MLVAISSAAVTSARVTNADEVHHDEGGVGACRNWAFECLRPDARRLISTWRRHYNDGRPHGALDNLTPSRIPPSLATGCLINPRGLRFELAQNTVSLHRLPISLPPFSNRPEAQASSRSITVNQTIRPNMRAARSWFPWAAFS